jgi:hypothetical protein
MSRLDEPMPRGLPVVMGAALVNTVPEPCLQAWRGEPDAHASFVDFPNRLESESGSH